MRARSQLTHFLPSAGCPFRMVFERMSQWHLAHIVVAESSHETRAVPKASRWWIGTKLALRRACARALDPGPRTGCAVVNVFRRRAIVGNRTQKRSRSYTRSHHFVGGRAIVIRAALISVTAQGSIPDDRTSSEDVNNRTSGSWTWIKRVSAPF